MIRVNVVTEGQSELYFVQRMLSAYPIEKGIDLTILARAVLTSKDKRSNFEFRGGLLDYARPKRDICSWLKESSDTYVTTMFDLFRLPNDFPGYQEAMIQIDPYKKVQLLENALKEDICYELPQMNPKRFIPYIQLHEFEALIYSDLNILKKIYLENDEIAAIDTLIDLVGAINPELINNGAETAPSKRLINTIPYHKGDDPVLILSEMGIDQIRIRCKHFSSWIDSLLTLEQL